MNSEDDHNLHKDLHLDDFVLIEKLGIGGMGEVWKAKQLTMNRDVALKILSPELSKDVSFVEKFLNEAVITGKLQHPNIITAYAAGNKHGYHYLATLLVDGVELLDKIKIDGIMQERAALKIARSIALALSYAWGEHHILHCDVKPGNIMIDTHSVAHLMDLGIAKIILEREELSKQRVVAGSLSYMSPEQIDGSIKLDARTDIYSLGVTLYQMLTATLPFDGKILEESISKKVEKHLTPAIKRNSQLSEDCSALMSKMMAENREDRQGNWSYVIADIDAVLAGNYLAKENVKRTSWQEIKVKREDFHINAPISLGKDDNSSSEEIPSKGTQKISKKTPENFKEVPQEASKIPPKMFDASKKRRSALKLLILLIILTLATVGAILYYF